MERIYNIGLVPYQEDLQERALFSFGQLNFLTSGQLLDRLTLITSSTNNGKTTLASQFMCDFIKQGFKCAGFFGEDTGIETTQRLYTQFIPYEKGNYISKNYVQNGKPTNIYEYHLIKSKWQEAHDFFDDKLFLYNTKCDHDIDNLIAGFDDARKNHGCRIMFVDNMENIEYEGDNENKRFKDIAIALRDYAINYKVAIIVIAHIRKLQDNRFLPTIDDVKGSSAVSNTAKNIIIILRTDIMDKSSKEYKSFAKLCELNNYNVNEADAVIMVPKTKGKKLGLFCVKFNKTTSTYYECKKIDEKREEPEKPIMHAPKSSSQELPYEPIDDNFLPF